MDHILSPIEKRAVSDQVFDKLVELIISGHYQVGDKLPPEITIAKKLGTGRNSVRESMKVLQILGIIERRQGLGSFIASPDYNKNDPLLIPIAMQIKDERDLVELRIVLHNDATNFAIDRATEEDLQKIKEKMLKVERLSSDPEHINMNDLIAADEDFHLSFALLSNNDAFITLNRIIMKLYRKHSIASWRATEVIPYILKDHRTLFNAVLNRDKQAAIDVTQASFGHWKDYVNLD